MEKLAERPALTPTLPSPDESGVVCLEDLIRLGGGVSTPTDPRDAFLVVSTPLSGDGLGLPVERILAAPIAEERRPLGSLSGQVVAIAAAALMMVGAAGAAAQLYGRVVPPAALAFSATESVAQSGGEPAISFVMVDVPGVVGESASTFSPPTEATESAVISRAVVAPGPLRGSAAPAAVRRNEPTPAQQIEAPVERQSAPLAGSFGDLVNGEGIGDAASSLPATPTRDQVRAGMRPATTRVLACGGPSGEVVTTRVVIDGPSGRVLRARVLGELAGTPVASCVEREIARSRFETFAASDFEVGYPFRL